ncbi:MAG: hypothetical protein RL266_616 [Bacteroidota bacterium]|jgi:hypothetical protein
MKAVLNIFILLSFTTSLLAQHTEVTFSTDRDDFAEDRILAEFVSEQMGSKETVRVLVVKPIITPDSLKLNNFSELLKELKQEVDIILAASEGQAEELRKQTEMDVKVINGVISDEVDEMLLNWTIVEATGSELGRVAGSVNLNNLVKGLTGVRNR